MKHEVLMGLTLITVLGCGQQRVDTKAEGEKVMQTSREWAKAASTGDIEGTLSYWADDAVVMSSGQPVLKGKKEIRQMIKGSFKLPGFKITWEPESVQVSQSGDLAYLVEKSQISMNDSSGKAVTQHYNGVTVWKKQSDGSRKNVADIATNEPQK
jgi:uncharacterized protein (TIGR02246 family)